MLLNNLLQEKKQEKEKKRKEKYMKQKLRRKETADEEVNLDERNGTFLEELKTETVPHRPINSLGDCRLGRRRISEDKIIPHSPKGCRR